jgi:hypothetical protein
MSNSGASICIKRTARTLRVPQGELYVVIVYYNREPYWSATQEVVETEPTLRPSEH